MDKPSDRRFTEEEAKRLIERATKLETARGALVSESELRIIAAEAGIDPTALSAAIAESVQLAAAGPTDLKGSSSFSARSALFATGLGIFTAAVAGQVGPMPPLFRSDLLGVSLLAAADLYLLVRYLRSRGHRRFQFANLFLCTGFAIGLAFILRDADAVPIAVGFGALAAAIGALVARSWNTRDGLLRRVRGFLKPRREDSTPSVENSVMLRATASA